MTGQLTAEEWKTLRSDHLKSESPLGDYCYMDGEDWPCAISRLIATIDAKDAEISKLRAFLREIADWPSGGNRYGQTQIQAYARMALSAKEWLSDIDDARGMFMLDTEESLSAGGGVK